MKIPALDLVIIGWPVGWCKEKWWEGEGWEGAWKDVGWVSGKSGDEWSIVSKEELDEDTWLMDEPHNQEL